MDKTRDVGPLTDNCAAVLNFLQQPANDRE